MHHDIKKHLVITIELSLFVHDNSLAHTKKPLGLSAWKKLQAIN